MNICSDRFEVDTAKIIRWTSRYEQRNVDVINSWLKKFRKIMSQRSPMLAKMNTKLIPEHFRKKIAAAAPRHCHINEVWIKCVCWTVHRARVRIKSYMYKSERQMIRKRLASKLVVLTWWTHTLVRSTPRVHIKNKVATTSVTDKGEREIAFFIRYLDTVQCKERGTNIYYGRTEDVFMLIGFCSNYSVVCARF